MNCATGIPIPEIAYTFDEASHVYRDASSKRQILSVTQVLDSTGIVDYGGAPLAAMERKSVIGTTVHSAVRVMNEKDEINWELIAEKVPDAIPYITAYEAFIEAAGYAVPFESHRVEWQGCVKLAQGPVGFQVDIIGMLGGLPVIVDVKCALKEEKSWAIQCAAYEECVLAMGIKPVGAPTFKRLALQLIPGANPPFKLHSYTDPMDKRVWQAAHFLATWKNNHGYDFSKEVTR